MVPFAGDGAGTGELTWGQQHIWGAMRALGAPMNLTAVRALDPLATVDDILDEYRYCVLRCHSLRTRLRFEPDGRPLQVVDGSGEVTLDLVDVPSNEDPAAAADALAQREEDRAFDHAHEYPIRKVVLLHRGAPSHLVTTLGHLASDRAGAVAMREDYLQPGRPLPLQPLELAAQQRTPAARRQSAAALAYWERLARTAPPAGPAIPVAGPRYWRVETESPAMRLAVPAIAARLGVDAATVLLAVYAIALARLTGTGRPMIQMLVSNRFRPGLGRIVSNISQTGICAVDVAGVSVAEVVARTRRASVRAYKNAYFDLMEWKAMLARLAAERAEETDLGAYYNDMSADRVDRVATPDEIRLAVARRTPLRWTGMEYFNERLMLTLTRAPGAIGLTVLADTHRVSKEDMRALVLDMQDIAVAAALDPAAAATDRAGRWAVAPSGR